MNRVWGVGASDYQRIVNAENVHQIFSVVCSVYFAFHILSNAEKVNWNNFTETKKICHLSHYANVFSLFLYQWETISLLTKKFYSSQSFPKKVHIFHSWNLQYVSSQFKMLYKFFEKFYNISNFLPLLFFIWKTLLIKVLYSTQEYKSISWYSFGMLNES